MIIQTREISLSLGDTDKVKNLGVSVQNAKDGKISNNVLGAAKDCAVQGEVETSAVYTEAEARQLHIAKGELLDGDSLISPADFISQCMTGEDAKALSDEETPLEEYTSSQLERALSRVKEQRSDKQEALDSQVMREREEQEAIEDGALRHVSENGIPSQIQRQLAQSDLPVTQDMIARLTYATELASERANFSMASMKFFIANSFAVTPENISGSVYGAGAAAERGTVSEDFETVEEQVENILKEAGLEKDSEALKNAKWLYENQLPVTAENVKLCSILSEVKELDTDTLIARIADNMADGMRAEKANLAKPSVEEAKHAMKQLADTEDSQLQKTFVTEADCIRARRQLEEIRLEMTVAAARAMMARGIRLEISHLEEIVEGLKQQERQSKEALLQETGLPITSENTRIMSDTVLATKQVLSAPIEFLGSAIHSKESQTLSDLASLATEKTAQFEKMSQTYEAVGTEVRRDLGDSMKKAFGNIHEILEELGMESTGMNQRAVRILGYNQMALTKENIEEMKAYDSKVTTLMENLKPPVVAELIKREINPLEISLDELNDVVEDIQVEMGGEDISFRKFLWKMDHQNGLTKEERESMIGVYRLLDKIEKSDGSVIGQVVKQGRELSLSSLLSALRTEKAEGKEWEIDDDFGGLERVVTKGTSISEQIQSAYASSVTGKLQKSLSPKVMAEQKENYMEMSLETLLELCQTQGETTKEMAEYYQQLARQIKEVTEDVGGQEKAFLEALEMPDTMANLAMAKAFLKGEKKDYTELFSREESEAILEAFEEPEELAEVYEKIDKDHEETLAKKKETDDITYDGVLALAKMSKGVAFYRTLRKQESFEVPIVTAQGVTECHVTLRSGESQKGTVEISMESDVLGKVQATFRVSEKHVKGFVTAEQTESLSECQRILDDFEKDLEENGFTMDSDSLIQGNRNSLHKINENRVQDTKNKDLYLVAKCFITNIARKDDAE